MEQRIAIVDLGTNTFHLMIVDINQVDYRILYRDRKAVKIGKEGINQGIITKEAKQRAIDTLKNFKETVDNYQVKKIYAFGTSAIRNASNKQELLEQILSETSMNVKVISGDEEARLIYLGVKSAIPLGSEKSLIMDIGGGSVEFIIGNDHEIFWKQSFEIGAQRLVEVYHRQDPINPDDLEQLRKNIDEKLKPLFDALDQYKPNTLVGSSGTFDTLSDIFSLREGISKSPDTPETQLTFKGFYEIYNELKIKNRAQRMQIPGMIELRVDMIVVACALIDYLLSRYTFDAIRVSSYALKEGVLAEIVEANRL